MLLQLCDPRLWNRRHVMDRVAASAFRRHRQATVGLVMRYEVAESVKSVRRSRYSYILINFPCLISSRETQKKQIQKLFTIQKQNSQPTCARNQPAELAVRDTIIDLSNISIRLTNIQASRRGGAVVSTFRASWTRSPRMSAARASQRSRKRAPSTHRKVRNLRCENVSVEG